MNKFELGVSELSVDFGALHALRDISFVLSGPDRVGIIGPNGAGKTTLLSAISGFVVANTGSIVLGGEDLSRASVVERASSGLVRSFQTARLLEDETVETNILVGCHSLPGPGFLRQLVGTRAARSWEASATVRSRECAALLGLTKDLNRHVSSLPSAQRRLVEVARVFASRPRVLILDEPAAGLDSSERVHLGEMLVHLTDEQPCLLILVEHDVSIVRKVCRRALVLTEGRLIADGLVDKVLELAEVRSAYFGGAHVEAN